MALVLRPEPPLGDWLTGLDALLGRSPGYFTSRPVVADLSAMPDGSADLLGLMDELSGRNIRVMAIEGTDAGALARWRSGCRPWSATAGPPRSSRSRSRRRSRPQPMPEREPQPQAAPYRPTPSLIIEKPIRSGQSISFAEGDITILGSVASGAEIVAGGSIHVYGALRGRAMAGFAFKDGRIFCSKLHAELLAVDGIYKTADEIDAKLRGRPIQAWSNGDALVIAGLG